VCIPKWQWNIWKHTDQLLSGRKFSKSALELKDMGLFDLTRMKVIKNSKYCIFMWISGLI